jgi:hypothetical protein
MMLSQGILGLQSGVTYLDGAVLALLQAFHQQSSFRIGRGSRILKLSLLIRPYFELLGGMAHSVHLDRSITDFCFQPESDFHKTNDSRASTLKHEVRDYLIGNEKRKSD